MAENGYTTIFHEGNEGVTIHTSGTLTITTSEPPVLRGSKQTRSNLWTVLTDGDKPKRAEANNVYNLPLTKRNNQVPPRISRPPSQRYLDQSN
jgi:hypothetical protein